MDGIPSPNPTYKQDIHNVTGTIKEVVGNGNLFVNDFSKYTAPYNYSICPIKLEVGERYHYSVTQIGEKVTGHVLGIVPFGEQYNDFKTDLIPLINSPGNAQNGTFLVTETYTSPKIAFYGTQEQFESILENYNIQLEPGDTATPYVPHAEQNLPFTLQEGQKMFARDYLEDDGIHHVRGEKVFDGTENWLDYMTQVEGYYKAYATSKKTNAYFYTNAICSHFTVKSVTGQNISSASEMIGSNQNATYISISSSIASNVTELKSWLAEQYANGTPVTAEYELAEEVIDPYTETQQAQYNAIKKAMSYKDTTVITLSSDDADPTTNVVAVADMSNLNTKLELMQAQIELLS